MGDESNFRIVIRGRSAHAGRPWRGIDPITIAAQVVTALQTIPSRQLDQGSGVSLITIGTIHGGTRRNIIPDQVEMTGTFRTLNAKLVDDAWMRIHRTVEMIAQSAGATAQVDIVRELPVTYNDPDLAAASLPTLVRVVGRERVVHPDPVLAAEDFAFYQEKIPGSFCLPGRDRSEGRSGNGRGRAFAPLFRRRIRAAGGGSDAQLARRRLPVGQSLKSMRGHRIGRKLDAPRLGANAPLIGQRHSARACRRPPHWCSTWTRSSTTWTRWPITAAPTERLCGPTPKATRACTLRRFNQNAAPWASAWPPCARQRSWWQPASAAS